MGFHRTGRWPRDRYRHRGRLGTGGHQRAGGHGHAVAGQFHGPAGKGELAPGLQQQMAPLGIEQQAVVHREQAPGKGQIAIGRQAAGGEAGRIGEQAGAARQGIAVEGRRLGRGGAKYIEHTAPQPQARGRAEAEGLNIAETGAAAQADAAGGEPEEIGGAAQLDGLINHRAKGIDHPHHQVAVALGLEQNATDGAAGIEGGEAVEQVGTGAGAAADRAEAGIAAAASLAIHRRAERQRPAGAGDLAGLGGRHQHGQAQNGQADQARQQQRHRPAPSSGTRSGRARPNRRLLGPCSGPGAARLSHRRSAGHPLNIGTWKAPTYIHSIYGGLVGKTVAALSARRRRSSPLRPGPAFRAAARQA